MLQYHFNVFQYHFNDLHIALHLCFRNVKSCFTSLGSGQRKAQIVLIGDSRIRNFFEFFKTSLGNVAIEYEVKPHHDMTWNSDRFNLKLDYFFAPFVNNDTIKVSFKALTKLLNALFIHLPVFIVSS